MHSTLVRIWRMMEYTSSGSCMAMNFLAFAHEICYISQGHGLEGELVAGNWWSLEC